MRSKVICCWLAGFLMLIAGTESLAQEKGFGLGVILGEPTGVSGKSWVSQRNAVDGGLAWSFGDNGSIHIHADYLWHFGGTIESSERITPYVGVGARVAAGNGGVFGIRVPVGLVWWPRNAPIDVFVELVPIVDLAPATELRANGGVGVRFYVFK